MPDDSVKKAVQVSLGVCLVCSLLVSTAAVTLKDLQEENKRLDKLMNILVVGGLYEPGADLIATYNARVKPVFVELSTGQPLEGDLDATMTIESFEIKKAVRDAAYSEPVPPEFDIAGIRRKPTYMLVHRVTEGGTIQKVILPIYGKGLWSTLYGFLALEKDVKTVSGITFYEHGETPGLGGEIENPSWKRKWAGTLAFDDAGEVKLEVVKGEVKQSDPERVHKVDGLSGSTLTTRGVDRLVRFWLGETGYGPYLKKLREAAQ